MSDIKFPKRKTGLIERSIDGEKVIFDNENNLIHQLNVTAAYIWDQCGGLKSEDLIVEAVISWADITLDKAKVDVAGALQQFRDLKLLESST